MDSTPPSVSSVKAISVRALLLGERLNTLGLDPKGIVSTTPLAFTTAQGGLVALFRFGAVVLFGLSSQEEVATLASLAERTTNPSSSLGDETASLIIQPDQEEQITAAGAIQLRLASPERLLIVADVLAKSVALGRDERQIATVIDAFEPFARNLAATGRSGSRRGEILRLIGQALLMQHRVAGSVAVRERPDIVWDRPDLERLYNRLEDEYELVERAETMDRNLSVVSASATALIDLKDAARSLRLELIIILLILAELVVGLVEMVR